MLTDINRIATLAKEDPARKFYSIAHLITEERLRQAFWKLRKDASAGIDGVVYSQYAADVEENIRQLHRRLGEGKYQAQPLRRVYIPKDDGKQRPSRFRLWRINSCSQWSLTIKRHLQQDFFDCSTGFGPGAVNTGRWTKSAGGCTRSTSWVLN